VYQSKGNYAGKCCYRTDSDDIILLLNNRFRVLSGSPPVDLKLMHFKNFSLISFTKRGGGVKRNKIVRSQFCARICVYASLLVSNFENHVTKLHVVSFCPLQSRTFQLPTARILRVPNRCVAAGLGKIRNIR
jgi:hypothetical protein